MNDLFIQGLTIDWNRVRPYNYVRQIPAISGIKADHLAVETYLIFAVQADLDGKHTVFLFRIKSGCVCLSRHLS